MRERLIVLHLETFADYHHYLRFGARAADEWDEAVDLLTTNETYFFREERQLRGFQQELLPLLQAQGRAQRRLTFWSAGYRNVTASYGVGGFTDEHLQAFRKHGTQRVLIAYDRDDAGEQAAAKLAVQLIAEGIECSCC